MGEEEADPLLLMMFVQLWFRLKQCCRIKVGVLALLAKLHLIYSNTIITSLQHLFTVFYYYTALIFNAAAVFIPYISKHLTYFGTKNP